MTLAALYNLSKEPAVFSAFTFANADHHFQTRNAIQKQKNIILTPYVLDPVADYDLLGFLRRHQQSHFDNNGALNLVSNDLSAINFDDEQQKEAWIQLHIQEHINWSTVLRVF